MSFVKVQETSWVFPSDHPPRATGIHVPVLRYLLHLLRGASRDYGDRDGHAFGRGVWLQHVRRIRFQSDLICWQVRQEIVICLVGLVRAWAVGF